MVCSISSSAAARPHGALTTWVLSTAADNAVRAAARRVALPRDYYQLNLRAGYSHYDSMCVTCHGAPGVDRQWLGKGLYPRPPALHVSVRDLSPSEVFWIIKYGRKDTGMPSLEPTHADDEVWPIAAFVKKLPEITPEEYGTFGQGAAGTPAAPGAPAEGAGHQRAGTNHADADQQQ